MRKPVVRNSFSKGFSLVELLVVVGIMGVVMLSSLTLFSNQISAIGAVQLKADVVALNEEIRSFLNTESNCAANFVGRSLNSPSNLANLVAVGGSPLYNAGGKYESARIRSMVLKDFTAFNPAITVNSRGTASLAVTYERTSEILGPAAIVKVVKLNVEVADTGSNTIQRCISAISPLPISPAEGSWHVFATTLTFTATQDGVVAIQARGDIGGGCAGGHEFYLRIDGAIASRAYASVASGHGGGRSFSHLYRMPVTSGTTYNVTMDKTMPGCFDPINHPSILAFYL